MILSSMYNDPSSNDDDDDWKDGLDPLEKSDESYESESDEEIERKTSNSLSPIYRRKSIIIYYGSEIDLDILIGSISNKMKLEELNIQGIESMGIGDTDEMIFMDREDHKDIPKSPSVLIVEFPSKDLDLHVLSPELEKKLDIVIYLPWMI